MGLGQGSSRSCVAVAGHQTAYYSAFADEAIEEDEEIVEGDTVG
jgi:hypothetical protein